MAPAITSETEATVIHTGSSTEIIQCGIPFHVEGCPGRMGGEHEFLSVTEVWCAHDERAAVVAVRMPYGIESLCVEHAIELAWGSGYEEGRLAAKQGLPPRQGIEQYQAEDR